MQSRATRRGTHHFGRELAPRLPEGALLFSRAGEYPDDGYTAGDNILCFQGYPETRRRAMFNFRLAFDDPSRDEPAKAFADIDEGESDGDIRGEWRGEWDMRLLPAHV